MDQTQITLTILGMAVVTFLPRLLPIKALSARSLPPVLAGWLKHMPIAVLAAMLVPTLLAPEGDLAVNLSNLYLWASIPAWLVARRTHSFVAAVLVGIAVVAIARRLL
ncbi:MAG: AzlD domain-containing protein [Chloroflexi bacterium]|nr:AzlD domain-containing protein [Chloroflexota bacterium]